MTNDQIMWKIHKMIYNYIFNYYRQGEDTHNSTFSKDVQKKGKKTAMMSILSNKTGHFYKLLPVSNLKESLMMSCLFPLKKRTILEQGSSSSICPSNSSITCTSL